MPSLEYVCFHDNRLSLMVKTVLLLMKCDIASAIYLAMEIWMEGALHADQLYKIQIVNKRFIIYKERGKKKRNCNITMNKSNKFPEGCSSY